MITRKSLAAAVTILASVVAACSGGAGSTDEGADQNLTGSVCGGIANIACGSGETCIDDPTDTCNPSEGGRDCSGVCVNVEKAAACGGIAGLGCATSGATCVDNPNDACDPAHGGVDCAGICVKGLKAQADAGPQQAVRRACGGVAGLACPTGLTCADDPSDACDPRTGGRDCSGVCVDARVEKLCGGFAAIPCPDGSACVDNPLDECDPAKGGRDCDGFCVEIQITCPATGTINCMPPVENPLCSAAMRAKVQAECPNVHYIF